MLLPDTTLDEALERNYDMVALPGGMPGMTNLRNDPRIIALLQKMAAAGKYTCAICAAPMVLAEAGLLGDKRATSYPGFLDKLNLPNVTYLNDAVVVDDEIITSRGPGTAMDFALQLIETLLGKAKRNEVEIGLQRSKCC